MSSATCTVLAALPEPLDPRDVSSMNFEQRLAHGRMIREEMNKATPDERKAYRDKMHQKMQALSPQERKELHQKMKLMICSICFLKHGMRIVVKECL